MNIFIRPMVIDDYDQVREVDIFTQRQYLGQSFDQMSKEDQETHLVSRKSEFEINLNTGYCFVAVENKKIIGFLFAYETLPFKGTIYIRYVGLRTEYQGKGIGLLLYEKLLEKAKKVGIKKIWALINLDNPKSMKLHLKAGFKLRDRKEAVLEI